MCRLFGAIAVEPESPSPWLLDAEIPLLRQANIDPQHLQGEGWGIAWYEPRTGRPKVEKGAESVYLPREREHFSRVARELTSPLVIAHLRKASNPMHLPREQLVALENSQPFLSESTVFAHNGWIPLPRETRPRLGAREKRVHGVNDSEVFQQLFLSHLDRTPEAPKAYVSAVRDLHEVWEEHGRPEGGPHGGLNILFAPSRHELWAFCFYTGEHGRCLSGLPRPYYEMSYQAEAGHAVVVSEPTDHYLEGWRPLRSGQYLHLTEKKGKIEAVHAEISGLPSFPSGTGTTPTLPPIEAE